MSHSREQIRDLVVASLKQAKTNVGSKVYPSRASPLGFDELPEILVYTKEETSKLQANETRLHTRTLKLTIEAVVKVTEAEEVDDQLDDIAKQIEDAMDANPFFGGAIVRNELSSTELGFSEAGKALMGHIMLTYELTYHTGVI